MNTQLEELSLQYLATMEGYLSGAEETALESAYEIGRKALGDGLGVLEMASVHHQALCAILADPAAIQSGPGMAGAAERIFVESLTPFEMALRGYREANEALKASEERYRELFENANDIVFTTDLSGKFLSVNKACERLTGYPRDHTPPVSILDVIPPEYSGLVRRMMERKIARRTTTAYELEIVTKDGRRIPMEVSTRLILRDGQPVGVQGIGRDITERRRAQEALRQLNDALEEQAKRIAHALHDEAGQLLATVHIALEEVARDVPAQTGHQFEKVRETLYQIEDQLRTFSHELRPTVLDDLGLRAGLQFLAKNVSKRTGISVSVENSYPGRLPAGIETALYRITQEALTNITKHAQAKSAVLRLEVKDKEISYSIRDDGLGFDAASVRSKRGERGLGLVGIQMRLDAFGGTFSINSEAQRGSELLMTIPFGR